MREHKCKECGSSDLVFDAQASWNEKLQAWELEQVFGGSTCYNCYAVNSAIEIEKEPA